MKILILRSPTGEVNNDPGWYFHLTLDETGIEHDLICHNTLVNDSIVLKGINYVARRVAQRPDLELIDRYRNADRSVLRRVKQLRPDLIMVMSGKTVRPCLLKEIRLASPRSKIVNVFWDNPFFYDIAFTSIPEYDVFFVKDTYVLNEMKKLGAKNVEYLPQACYPKEHKPLHDITAEERAKYGSDLSFVGSMYPYRARILDIFKDMDLRIWGGEPWGDIPKDSVAYTKHQGERVWGRQKVVIFNVSKINLNTQSFQNDIFSVSSKVHQVAASGGFQLVDYKPDLERLYKVGSEIIAFQSRDELRELAEYYLEHPAERAEIAERALRRALREHTFDHRLDGILRVVRSC